MVSVKNDGKVTRRRLFSVGFLPITIGRGSRRHSKRRGGDRDRPDHGGELPSPPSPARLGERAGEEETPSSPHWGREGVSSTKDRAEGLASRRRRRCLVRDDRAESVDVDLAVPRRVLVTDEEDALHVGQQLRLFRGEGDLQGIPLPGDETA